MSGDTFGCHDLEGVTGPVGRIQGRCSTLQPQRALCQQRWAEKPQAPKPGSERGLTTSDTSGRPPTLISHTPRWPSLSHLHVTPAAPSSSLDTRSWALRRPLPSRPQIASLRIKLTRASPCGTLIGPGAVPGATVGPGRPPSRVCGPPSPASPARPNPPGLGPQS